MATRAKASDPCKNLASCTVPSRPTRTCKVTVAGCPVELAGKSTAGWSVSSARSAASGITTGSIACMAASGALFPPASGVIDAICDFKLDGTLAEAEAVRGCGETGAEAAAGGAATAGVSECGVVVPGATVELGAGAGVEEVGVVPVGVVPVGVVPVGVVATGVETAPEPGVVEVPPAGCAVSGVDEDGEPGFAGVAAPGSAVGSAGAEPAESP